MSTGNGYNSEQNRLVLHDVGYIRKETYQKVSDVGLKKKSHAYKWHDQKAQSCHDLKILAGNSRH